MKWFSVFIFFVCSVNKVFVLDNGLALRPPMGWMSWGYFMCADECEKNPNKCLDEKLILSVADSFFMEGYQEAGYEYIIIDDCWSEKQRDEDGRLVPDRKRFPHGMEYLADYIHSRGLKFGMYINIAEVTCMRYPGSKGHFMEDAKTFATWGVDYIKVDGCFVSEDYLNTAYIELGKYLNMTGRPMVYSCSWPYYIEYIHHKQPNYTQVSKYCNLWRNYHDVFQSWGSVKAIIEHYSWIHDDIHMFHGPSHWNDPDMLVFGSQILTPGQSRIQISVFAMLSAPLLLSCDMKRISAHEKSLLLNMDLIAVAQDPMGVMAKPYHLDDRLVLWVKPHMPKKGDRYPAFSFLLVNMLGGDTSVSLTPAQYGLNSTDTYTVLEVFSSKYIKNITLQDSLLVSVPREGRCRQNMSRWGFTLERCECGAPIKSMDHLLQCPLCPNTCTLDDHYKANDAKCKGCNLNH